MSPRRSAAEALKTRGAVLDAAFFVAREGAGRFTIDAVAAKAGVSKGAVLHHFPSKEALAIGMLERELDVFEEAVERLASEEEEECRGRWLRAYVRANFEMGAGDQGVRDALFAVTATNPGLLSAVEGKFEAWRRRAESDGVDPTRANVVRMAADGLVFSEYLGFDAPRGAEREALLGALLDLTRGPGL